VTGKNTQKYFSLLFEYKDDHRDIRNYPLKGYFFNLRVIKDGFGFTSDDPNVLSTTVYFKKFWELSPIWHISTSAKFKLSGQNDVPFFNQRALGYDGDVLRGYEYYVINGENYSLFKYNLKYTLLRQRIYKVPISILKKFSTIPYAFYINAFADAGYVRDRRFGATTPLANSWQYSYGAGIDYVTYYDIVLRVDYAINRFKEHGFFIHLTAPI
jgi:outer membrane protein assembly factor BamA